MYASYHSYTLMSQYHVRETWWGILRSFDNVKWNPYGSKISNYAGIRPVILYKIKMFYIDVSSSFIRLPNTFTSMLSTYVAFVVFNNVLWLEKFPILFWYVIIAVLRVRSNDFTRKWNLYYFTHFLGNLRKNDFKFEISV